MNLNHKSFQNSLRCLQHPATVLSILLLLINDHVLKITSPSWLTGKLSDFAGLFFFPFIVATGFSIFLAKFNVSSRRIGQLAFGLVIIWFTLLKTSSFVNFLTVQFASLFIGPHPQFIPDPTDVIALIAVIPAWRLWNQHQQRLAPTRFAYVALAIGAFAVMATSPKEQTIYSVTDLNYSEDGIIYAADKDEYSEKWFPVAISRDGGLTWELSYDDGDMQNIDQKIYPVDYCKYIDYYQVTHCYQVTQTQQFQYAFKYARDKDASYSWSPVFPPQGMTIRAYDMIVFPCDDHECILIAIGEAGVLRQVFDGNWELIPVLRAGSNEVFRNNP